MPKQIAIDLWNRPFDQIVGRTIEIPLEQITSDSRQPRKTFKKKPLLGLAASIKRVGLRQPITVNFYRKANAKNTFVIDSGDRRYRAHQINDSKTIRATVQNAIYKDEIIVERFLEQFSENDQREPQSHSDIIKSIEYLMQEYTKRTGESRGAQTYAVKQLAEATGRKESWFMQYTLLMRLNPEFVEKLDSEDDDTEAELNFQVGISLSGGPANEQKGVYEKSLKIKEKHGVSAQRTFVTNEVRKIRSKAGDPMKGRPTDLRSLILRLSPRLCREVEKLAAGKRSNMFQAQIDSMVDELGVMEIDEILRGTRPFLSFWNSLSKKLEAKKERKMLELGRR